MGCGEGSFSSVILVTVFPVFSVLYESSDKIRQKKNKVIFKQSIRIPARFCQESNLEESCSIRYNADHHCCLGLGCTEMGEPWGLDPEAHP